MAKKAYLAGGCFWGEKRIHGASQEVARWFWSETNKTIDNLNSFCKK